jgi:hypothetical protein
MTMVYIDKIPETRPTRATSIRVQENDRKGLALVGMGLSPDEAIALLRSGSLRGYYESRFISPVNSGGKRLRNDQQSAYDTMRKLHPGLQMYANIEQYKQATLLYNVTPEYLVERKQPMNMGNIIKMASAIASVLRGAHAIMKNSGGYTEVVSVINADSYFPTSESEDDPLSLISLLFRRKQGSDILPNGDILLVVSPKTGTMTKITFGPDMDQAACERALRSQLRITAGVKNTDIDSVETVKSGTDTVAASIATSIKRMIGVDPSVRGLTGSEADVAAEVDGAVDRASDAAGDDADAAKIAAELEKDEVLKDYMEKLAKDRRVEKVKATDRSIELSTRQDDVKVGSRSMKAILADFASAEIRPEPLPITTIDESVKFSTLRHLDELYMNTQHEKDMVAVAASFSSDADYPLFVKKIDRTDSSDEMNVKETLTVEFADNAGKSYTMRLDLPKLIDGGRFMFLQGSKKQMRRQLFPVPVVKTGGDEVRITTNYNRLYLYRFGQKSDRHVEQIRKAATSTNVKLPKGVKMKIGDARVANQSHPISVEHMEMSSWLLTLQGPGYFINLDVDQCRSELEGEGLLKEAQSYPEGMVPIGWTSTREVLYSKVVDGTVVTKSGKLVKGSIAELTTTILGDEISKMAYSSTSSKARSYSRLSIVGKKIPTALIVGYAVGLRGMLDRAVPGWRFEPGSRRRASDEEKKSYEWIDFKDGRLWYPSRPLRNRLLLNGLLEVDTESYDFVKMDEREPWASSIEAVTGSRSAVKAVDNTVALLIDPITKDILQRSGLPDDFAGVLVYASGLLDRSGFSRGNDISHYRVRGPEMLNVFLYQTLANSYRSYRDSRRFGTRETKMTAPKDAVIRAITDSQVVSDYAVLNPVLEAEEMSAISAKGPSGINMDDAYTIRMRAYDESMVGVLALNTPDSFNVGVVRHLTYNPRILDARGTIAPMGDVGKLKGSEILSIGEALTPFTNTHADPPRTGMAVTQSKHVVPIRQQNRPMVGNGVEKALAHVIGSDFAFKAVDSGVVKEIDTKLGVMVLQYKDGKTESVDLSDAIASNRGGGFHLRNRKVTGLKTGDKFKKGQVVAWNAAYFSPNSDGDHVFTQGRLTKVAIMGADFTIEDSSIITESLKSGMATRIIMRKAVPLGSGSNVDKMAWKGDMVKTGDTLIAFEQSFEDESANKLLDKIGKDLGEAIGEIGKNVVQSKWTGEVVDVKVYWNVPLDTLGKSAREIVDRYVNSVKRRDAKIRKGHTTEWPSAIEPVPLVELPANAKISGKSFDGILIEFYVETELDLGIGDKIAFDTALKTIVADVIPQEEAPYSEHKPEEYIEAITSPLGVAGRLVTDVFNKMYTNKVLIGLKEAFGKELGIVAKTPMSERKNDYENGRR